MDDRLDLSSKSLVVDAELAQPSLADLLGDIENAVGRHIVGKLAGQQLVENHTECVDVAPGVDVVRVGVELLRAHVLD